MFFLSSFNLSHRHIVSYVNVMESSSLVLKSCDLCGFICWSLCTAPLVFIAAKPWIVIYVPNEEENLSYRLKRWLPRISRSESKVSFQNCMNYLTNPIRLKFL